MLDSQKYADQRVMRFVGRLCPGGSLLVGQIRVEWKYGHLQASSRSQKGFYYLRSYNCKMGRSCRGFCNVTSVEEVTVSGAFLTRLASIIIEFVNQVILSTFLLGQQSKEATGCGNLRKT